jgi:hypothetical protein
MYLEGRRVTRKTWETRRAPVVELVALAEVEVVDGAVEVALLERHPREAPARVAAAEHLVAAAGPVEVARGGHVEDLAAERHVDRRVVVAAVERAELRGREVARRPAARSGSFFAAAAGRAPASRSFSSSSSFSCGSSSSASGGDAMAR